MCPILLTPARSGCPRTGASTDTIHRVHIYQRRVCHSTSLARKVAPLGEQIHRYRCRYLRFVRRLHCSLDQSVVELAVQHVLGRLSALDHMGPAARLGGDQYLAGQIPEQSIDAISKQGQ